MLRSKRREHETPFDPELAGVARRRALARMAGPRRGGDLRRARTRRARHARETGRPAVQSRRSSIRHSRRIAREAYELVHVAGGWQLRTKARYADAIPRADNGAGTLGRQS